MEFTRPTGRGADGKVRAADGKVRSALRLSSRWRMGAHRGGRRGEGARRDPLRRFPELFILICATERSGSTTLQRIINTIEESNINGENWGAINNLLECYKNIKKTNKEPWCYRTYVEGKTKIKPSWYNCFDFENVKNNIKNTILSIITNDNSKKVVGFKEIRYLKKTYLIDEFIELFPNTKVICHIDDNIDRQCTSAWLKKKENSKEYLTEKNNELINYSKSNKNCYLSYMKNLFIINEIKKMFEFLGQELDEEKYNYIINNSLE